MEKEPKDHIPDHDLDPVEGFSDQDQDELDDYYQSLEDLRIDEN